jgi:hypothetical protein
MASAQTTSDDSSSTFPKMTSDRFFAGFLAGIKLAMRDRLPGSRLALNRAFCDVMNGPEGKFARAADLSIDFDPLYGVSPWFERALTRAQRDLLVSFPNPTYAIVEIKLNEEQAKKMLDLTGNKDQFIALAKAFVSKIKVEQ